MIFDLPPLFGLIPLILYLALLIWGMDLVFATFITVVLAAVMTGQTLNTFSNALVAGLGSFLGMIGLIVIVGAGLGKVLLKTNVAQTFVHFILDKIGLSTKRQAIFAIMLAAGGLTCAMGTSNGVLAILAPIIIPVCASLQFTKSAVGVLMHGAACVGLFLGPFTPPTITTLSLAGISYGSYMLHAAVPISVLILISTFFVVFHVQKATEADPNNFYTTDDFDTTQKFVPSKDSNRNTLVFFGVILAMVVYGMLNKSGASFALTVELLAGIAVAMSAKMKAKDFVNNMCEGASLMMRLFMVFVLCAVMLNFIMDTGAFAAMADIIAPHAKSAGPFGFAMLSTFVGVFGITGAAVAQEQILATLFAPTVELLKFPAEIWAIILLVGSQITSFVIPGGDIYAPMSLARSDDLKSMMKQGVWVAIVTIGYIAVRALLV